MSHRQYSVQGNQIEKLNARLLSISFSKDEMDWKSVFHSHPFTELFYVVSGEGNFLFRGETYHIKTGDLIIVPPYMEHTEQSSSDLQYYAIGVEGISFQKKGEPACVQIYCNFQSKSVVANLLSLMFFEMSNPSYGSDKICQDLLEILLLWIIRDQHVIPVAFSATYMTKECAQIKDYLEDSSQARMEADEARRENEKLKKEVQTLRSRLEHQAAEPKKSAQVPGRTVAAPAPISRPAGQNRAYSQPAPEQKEKSTLDQEIMEFFQSGEAEE